MRVSCLEYECQNQSKQKKKLSCFILIPSLIKHRTSLLNLVEELGSISQAHKIMGMSYDTFYYYQQAGKPGVVSLA